MRTLVKMTVPLVAMALACAGARASLDGVRFGDEPSEKAHGVTAENAPAKKAALGEPCRRIGPDGSLAFDLRCDPGKQNYLTVKFWGSDSEMATLFLFDGGRRIGKYGDASPELDLGMGGAAFPGRFYYTTYLLPRSMTAGKDTVRVKLGAVGALSPYESHPRKRERPLKGLTRGIYRAYSDTDPFFRADADEAQGREPPAQPRARPEGFPDVKQLQHQLADAVAGLKNWQVYGPAWDEAVARGKVPAAVLGAIAPGAKPTQAKTAEEWKDAAALPTTQGNAVDLNVLAIFAQAYQGRWSRHFHDPELLDRVVKGLDCYAALQGSNGSFFNKTWVGGPQRRPAAGSALEGFGTQGLGRALLLVRRELEEKKLLDQPIDEDADPATPPVPRREAWATMFARHRDFLASAAGRGHAGNQDMAQMTSLWLANEAARALVPGQGWPREKALTYVRAAVGLERNPLGGYWVTRKGLALEPWGTLGGGYCGNYGLMCVHEITGLAEITGDPAVQGRALEAIHAASHFYYPDVDEHGHPCLKKEGIISTRNTKWPCVTDYGWDYYAAGGLKDPLAVRAFQLALAEGVMPSVAPGAHVVDELKDLVRGMEHLETVLALPPTDARLPMEPDQPDFAWADEQGAAVAVKHRGARMYVSLNWRRGFKDDKRDAEHTRVNNTARVHFTTPTVDRIATIAMESPQGFGKLYVCRYGDYLIGMNLTDETEFTLPVPPGVDTAKDLVSGKALELKTPPRIPPSTTLVLYLGP